MKLVLLMVTREEVTNIRYGATVIQYITVPSVNTELYTILYSKPAEIHNCQTLVDRSSSFLVLYFRLNVLSGTQQTQECSVPPAGTRKLKYGTQIT